MVTGLTPDIDVKMKISFSFTFLIELLFAL